MATKFDLVVIGAGPGGYVAAIRAGQLGLKTAIVERDRIGGVCLNYGCIPSKGLIYASGLFEKMQHADTFGFSFEGPAKVDGVKLQAWKAGVVKRLTTGVGFLLSKSGVTVLPGTAKLTGKNTMSVTGADGKAQDVEFAKCIVATGARPVALPTFPVDGKVVMTSKEILDLDRVPENLVVIGGGVIGLEMGMVFLKLGSKLTVVELTDSLLPGVDPEAVKVLEKSLSKRGATILKSTKAGGLVTEKGKTFVTVTGPDGAAQKLPADVVLVAIGFKPNSEGLGLEALGIALDKRGHLSRRREPPDERPPRLCDRRRRRPPLARAQGEQGGHRGRRARGGQDDGLRRQGDAVGHLHRPRDRHRRPPGARGEGAGHRGQGGQVPLHRARQGARDRRRPTASSS